MGDKTKPVGKLGGWKIRTVTREEEGEKGIEYRTLERPRSDA